MFRIIFVYFLFISTAYAQTYMCKDGGTVVFQDRPCNSVVSKTDGRLCNKSLNHYESLIQSGGATPAEKMCLSEKRKEKEQQEREAAQLAAEEVERTKQLAMEKERQQRLAEEKKDAKRRRTEQQAKIAEEKAKYLEAFKKAQAKIVESDDPELTKLVLQKGCLRHILDTHSFKDPDSVRVEGAEYGWVVNDSLPRYAILLDINAKNSWGAYVGAKQYRCFLSEDGQRLNDVQD
jgi:hypothetical protein